PIPEGAATSQLLIFRDDADEPLSDVNVTVQASKWSATVTVPYTGEYTLRAAIVRGNQISARSAPIRVGIFDGDLPPGADVPTISRGIRGPTGPYVSYPEFTPPRPVLDGFNPSDRVETRVSRLYFFRNAHRVAQIITRSAKSYNHAAVTMQQQLADRARFVADEATDERRAKERAAEQAARETREAEAELEQAQQSAELAAASALAAASDLQQSELELANASSDAERSRIAGRMQTQKAAVESMNRAVAAARTR